LNINFSRRYFFEIWPDSPGEKAQQNENPSAFFFATFVLRRRVDELHLHAGANALFVGERI
jgi:hypothetical protein